MKYMHVLIGLAMGPMLLWALHGRGADGVALFVAGHVAVVAVVAALLALGLKRTAFGARLAAHRPHPAHVVAMIGAMGASALAAHLLHALTGHGGGAI